LKRSILRDMRQQAGILQESRLRGRKLFCEGREVLTGLRLLYIRIAQVTINLPEA
jgi:hypothetical protein